MGQALETAAKGQGAVITGSASGIGKGVAKRCLELGMHVLLVDLNPDALKAAKKDLAAEVGGDAESRIGTCAADVSAQQDNVRMKDEALAFLKGRELAFLHLNAGILIGKIGFDGCYKLDFETEFKKTIEVDLFSVFHGFQNFVPLMTNPGRTAPGVICTTASTAGLANNMAAQAYNVAKHGVVALTESLSASLAKDAPHLSVHLLCPFNTDTGLNRNAAQFGDRTAALAASGNKAAQAVVGAPGVQGILAKTGASVDDLVDRLQDCVKAKIFYVVGFDKMNPTGVEVLGANMLFRAQDLLLGRPPSPMGVPMTPDMKQEMKETVARAKAELKNGKWAPVLGSKL